jgi:hypothetical protein
MEPCHFSINLIFKLIQFCNGLKDAFPNSNKFQIKYGCEVFELMNNLPYSNFARFEKDFELKIKEASRV